MSTGRSAFLAAAVCAAIVTGCSSGGSANVSSPTSSSTVTAEAPDTTGPLVTPEAVPATTTLSISTTTLAATEPALDVEYLDAWTARFTVDGSRQDFPFEGIEECAAGAAATGLDADRLAAAGLTPEDIADGDGLAPAAPTTRDAVEFGTELAACDLGPAYASAIRIVMPAFISEPDATCVGTEIGADPEYSEHLADWVYRGTGNWVDAVVPEFHRALVSCPAAYGTISVGGIERKYGPLPPEGAACLAEQIALEVVDLLSGDPERSDPAFVRALEPCLDSLGEFGVLVADELASG
jgi:hypothetical protein